MAAFKILLAPGSVALFVLALAAGAAGVWRGGRLARGGRLWIAVWVLLYFLLSLPIVARQLQMGLMSSAAAFDSSKVLQMPALVVLSGGAGRYRIGSEDVSVMTTATSLRVLEAARVYRHVGSPLVIASGSGPRGERSPEVPAMRDGLLAAGVPAERIVLERASRDTRESALAVRGILQSRQLAAAVLVTSAEHIPRAMRAFRAAGVDVVAAPAPSHAGAHGGWRAFVPDTGALALSETCLHEYLGLAYYWMRGWS